MPHSSCWKCFGKECTSRDAKDYFILLGYKVDVEKPALSEADCPSADKADIKMAGPGEF